MTAQSSRCLLVEKSTDFTGGTGERSIRLNKENEAALLSAIPALRAFATSMCGSSGRADDFVQEALVRAIANIGSFESGTCMLAWLVTILRNIYRSNYRKRWREVEDPDETLANAMIAAPEQEWAIDFSNLRGALGRLPLDQREAVILVGAAGFSYEEAGKICGCAQGTIKSRVHRARVRLFERLGFELISGLRPNHRMPAAPPSPEYRSHHG
jgi:RNA polymerase sigma-70 factor, ECF subfamily